MRLFTLEMDRQSERVVGYVLIYYVFFGRRGVKAGGIRVIMYPDFCFCNDLRVIFRFLCEFGV